MFLYDIRVYRSWKRFAVQLLKKINYFNYIQSVLSSLPSAAAGESTFIVNPTGWVIGNKGNMPKP